MENKKIVEEVVLQFKKIYDEILNLKAEDLQPEDNNMAKANKINYYTLCAHGTNGFVLLLSLLTGQQLLSGNKREQKGIPIVTGEAQLILKTLNKPYHNLWQNFVSSINLHDKFPSHKVLEYYTSVSSYNRGYDVFAKKLHKIVEKLQNQNLNNLLDEINKKELEELYYKLTDMKIIIVGDGVGLGSTGYDEPGEKRYEEINIKAIVVADKDKELIQELLNVIKIQDVFN